MSETWDYIIVGAGHNGLSAGATLGEKGRTVLVVEKLPFIGGLSTSQAWVKDAPNHLLSVGAMDDMMMAQTPLTEELGLRSHGYDTIRLEAPYGWIGEDGETLLLFADFERAVAEIRRHSAKDAETYRRIRPTMDFIMDLVEKMMAQPPREIGGKRDLFKILTRLAPDKASRRLIGQMASTSVFEIIGETFESDAMRGLWAYWTSMLGPADLEGTGVFLMGFHATHRPGGISRPRGGMTNLMEAFATKIRSHGGEVRTGNGVEQILIEGTRAVGVRMADGTQIRARHGVLTNCAPQVTFGQLMPPESMDRDFRNKIDLIPSNSVNVAAFKVDIAAAGRLGYIGEPRADGVDVRKTTLMTGTLEDHIAQLASLKLGQQVADPPVYMSVLSAADGSLAPEGQDVVYIHSNVPADPVGGWGEEAKAQHEKTIMTAVERFMTGLDTEIGRVVHSPADFQDDFGSPKGNYFHVDMTPLRLGVNRPARGLGHYSTPWEGLYLAGAGSHPGGTITGWPGRLAAQEALRIDGRG